MECLEFETLLQQRLDERLVPDCPELHSHAAACPACALLLSDAILLEMGVAAWRMQLPVAPHDLTSRITDQVLNIIRTEQPRLQSEVQVRRAPAQSTAPSTWQTWAVLAATVAAVWLVFAGSITHPPAGRRVAATLTPAPRSQPRADLGSVLISAEGAYSQLANESLAAAQDFALLWPASSASATAQPPSAGSPGPGAEWSPTLSNELAPIGHSVEDAWNFLRRAVPQVQKSST